MKKNLIKSSLIGLAVLGACTLTSCGGEGTGHEEFLKAADNSIVTVETYIQAKFPLNAWGSTNMYAQDKDGGYYIYRYYCDQATYDSLTIGSKVRITGTRASWSGLVEFGESHDTKIELLDGKWIAKPIDVTKSLGDNDAMLKLQNCYVKFPKAKVVAADDGNPIRYKGGQRGDDIYLRIECNSVTTECCIECDFTGPDTETYKAVETLKVGDKIDLFGYLNWFNMPNPHVSSIKKL